MKIYFSGLTDKLIHKMISLTERFNKYEKIDYKMLNNEKDIVKMDEIQIFFCVPESILSGIDGINFAEKIRKKNDKAFIIFLSQNMLSAVPILKRYINPTGYFLYDECEDVVNLIETILKIYISKQQNFEIDVTCKYKKMTIKLKNVNYFVSINKKIVCNMINGKAIEFYGTLSEIENKYGDMFLRCHSGYLVNRKQILYVNHTEGTVKLAGCEDIIPVSRKYKTIFKDQKNTSKKAVCY